MTRTRSATSESSPESEGEVFRPRGRRFARRSYPARVLGLGLGFLAVAAVFWSQSRSWPLWVLLATYTFVWPHIAYLYASRVSDSYRTGQRQLMFDAVCGGLWAAAMSFNLLPSVLILTMLSMNNMAAGGVLLFLKGSFAQVVGLLGGVVIFGWNPQWDTSLIQTVACIPFLAVHPLAVGAMTYGFAQRLHAQKNSLKLLSRTDGLTGLYNRRFWELRAAEEFQRSRRGGQPAVLLMLDIDHFKRINDRHGHGVGDDVLQDFSYLLQTHLRSIDVVGRYGGEEFAVILLDVKLEFAQAMAERLRQAVASDHFGINPPLRCTTSIGIAPLVPELDNVREWLNAADQALYQAKADGRNCSRIHRGSARPLEKQLGQG